MPEMLQEYVDSRAAPLRVDRSRGVLHGVKILGRQSRNGREYEVGALEKAVALYEDAKVNVNHPKGDPGAPRDYQDRIGVIRGVQSRDDEGLYADFYFNPKHALAEQLLWDAEHAPENVGFSHNVQARVRRDGDRTIVEEIVKVQSVDLVADPATTEGLFENDAARAGVAFAELTVEAIRERRPDLMGRILEEAHDEMARLRDQIEALEAERDRHAREALIEGLLEEQGLVTAVNPRRVASLVGKRFFESLLAAPDESAVRELIEERSRAVQGRRGTGVRALPRDRRPQSREQGVVEGAVSSGAEDFVRRITSF